MPMTRPGNAVSYEEDFVAWLEDQAGRARRGKAAELDLENIAEELEGMARSDRRGNSQPSDRAADPFAEVLGSAETALGGLACDDR
jgi:Domain of unknown function DUF29